MLGRLACAGALALCLLAGVTSAAPAVAQDRQDRLFPENIDPAERYVFFLHGRYMDKRGPRGEADYYGILDAIEEMGFVTIGDVRGLRGVDSYADIVATDVRKLLDAGVPPGHITVAGHSMAGFVALLTSARVGDPGVSYAVFAGCSLAGTRYRRPFMKFVNSEAQFMKGRFVVAWAEDDTMAQDCNEAMRQASVTYRNVVLPGGLGHRLFNTPDRAWLDILGDHAGGIEMLAQKRKDQR